ncbi:MAG: ferritin-like domain-containing protein [Acidimicrobiales bacterium]
MTQGGNDHPGRRAFLGRLLAGSAATSLLLGESTAAAATLSEVDLLQTAASVENLLVASYQQASELAILGGAPANPLVHLLLETYVSQHQAHATACNARLDGLKASRQTGVDSTIAASINGQINQLHTLSPTQATTSWVGIGLVLENLAAETYVSFAALLPPGATRKLFASVMGVEAQHFCAYLILQSLLTGPSPSLAALNTQGATLFPAGVATIGFPNSLYPAKNGAAPTQGVVAG